MLKKFLNKIDPVIDYTGQALSEKCLYMVFMIGYAISLILGLVLSDLKYTLYGAIVTVLTSVVIVGPAWPFYRKNPVSFVPLTKEKKE